MQQMPITTLDLMRHGEPVGGRKYRGQTDDPLSETGWTQMRSAVGDHCPWQVIISSPLSRCADFSRELAKRHELPLEIDARLTELGFGIWEGRTAAELTAENSDIIVNFRRDPITSAPPGAEPIMGFRSRIVSVWNAILERHRGEHVLVVAHAGVIRMMIGHVLEVPLQNIFRLHVANAGISRIRLEQHGDHLLPQLLFHGGKL
jgi:alpha-ribazole phosphatase